MIVRVVCAMVLAVATVWGQGIFAPAAFTPQSASTQTPLMIQGRGTPSDVSVQNAISVANGFMQVCMPNATQVGDKMIVADINNQTSSANATMTDDGSNSYTVPSGASEIAGSRQIQFHVAPVSTTSRCIKNTYASSAPIDDQLIAFEYNNLGSFDVACAATVTSGTSIACSSMTTTAPGDLIIACANVVTFGSTPTGNMSWTAQGGGWQLFNPSGTDWSACQILVQSAAGSITPTLTVSTAVTRANIVAVSYKAAAGGGSIPSTIWLSSIQSRNDHGFSNAQTATTRTEVFPCVGNEGWIITGQIDTDNITGITDSNSASYTGLTKVDSAGDGFEIQWWHASITCSATYSVTVTYASNPATKVPLIIFFDVSHSAGYDSSATCGAGSTPCAINNSLASNPPVAFPGATITPSVASVAHPSLILSYQNQDFNTISGVSPGTFLTAVETCPGTTSGCAGGGTSTTYAYVGSGLEQDAGILADTVTTTSAVAITWTPQNTQSQSNGASFSSTVAIKSQ